MKFTDERKSPAPLAGSARQGKPNLLVGAKKSLLETHARNQARFFRAFEIEEETPEEIEAMQAEATARGERRRQFEAVREAERRREAAQEEEWRRRNMAQAQAEQRRERDRQARKDSILEARERAALADAELKEFILAAKRAPAAEADSPEAVEAALVSRLFDAANPPPPPVAILRLGDATVCTPGNISNIQAPAKAGKSAVIGAILAAFLS